MSGGTTTTLAAATSRKREREDVEQGSTKRVTTEELHFEREVQPAWDDVRRDTVEQSKWQTMFPANNFQPFYSSCFGIDDNIKPVSGDSHSDFGHNMLTSQHREQLMQQYASQHPAPQHPVEGFGQDPCPRPPNPLGLATSPEICYSPQLGQHVNPQHPSQPVELPNTTSDTHAAPTTPSGQQRLTQANVSQTVGSGSRYSNPLFQAQAVTNNVETRLEHCEYAPQSNEYGCSDDIPYAEEVLYTVSNQASYIPNSVQLQAQPVHKAATHQRRASQPRGRVYGQLPPIEGRRPEGTATSSSQNSLTTPSHPVAPWATSTWQSKDVNSQQWAAATQYLRLVRSEMEQSSSPPSQVPGIPEHYLFDFEKNVSPLQPNDMWTLRHFPPDRRLAEYLNFDKLVKIMLKSYHPRNGNFWTAWFMLKRRTELIRCAEHVLYQAFAKHDEDDDYERAQRQCDWYELIHCQSFAVPFQAGTGQLSLPSPSIHKPTKRPADFGDTKPEEGLATPPPPKKVRVVEHIDLTSEPELVPQRKPLNPLPDFENKWRDTLDDHKEGRNAGDTPVYTTEQKEVVVGAASNIASLAKLEEEKAIKEAKEKRKSAQRGSNEGDDELPPWKRRYSGDIAILPDRAFALEDYTAGPDGKYKCLHESPDCHGGTCGKVNHKCCRDGLTPANFKKALGKKKVTYEKQVERLVNRGELDKRHITWTPRLEFDEEGKAKGSKKKSPKTKPAAQVSPAPAALLETQLPPGRTPEQPQVPQVEESEIEQYDRMTSAHREKYTNSRSYPDLPYFDAWFSARRSMRFSASLTEDEKIWSKRPPPRNRADRPSEQNPIAGPQTAAEKELAEEKAAEKKAAEKEASERVAAEKEAVTLSRAEVELGTACDVPGGTHDQPEDHDEDDEHDSLFGD
jgi:hypothetical protein